ncbi:MAG: 5'-nucleotidase C-terminal domain-containing protein, partial [Bacteroidota bacterium]
FSTVVGMSDFSHESFDVGCFFTTGLKEFMNVDFTIQNLGGIRAGIDQGPITRMEIFTMDPFNNQSVAFTKTVGEFENFFCETGSRFFFSGIQIDDSGNDFQIVDANGVPLPDNQELTMGVNDYIPAVFDDFFDFEDADIKDYTTAQAIIGYLQNINSTIDFKGCSRVLQCD